MIEVQISGESRVTTAGDSQLKSSAVRQSFGVDGAFKDFGVNNKIGVMSDGATNWLDAFFAGELDLVTVKQLGSGNEGTAMLEIVHDIAPGALLYFSGLKSASLVEWAERISDLVTEGCNIIVDDWYLSDYPFFSDETELGAVIRNFIANGNIYITSAGNDRKSCLPGITSFIGNYHRFPSGLDYYPVTITERQYMVLQWNTPWFSPVDDLDLELYDIDGNRVRYSDDTQSAIKRPYERISFDEPLPLGTYRIKIKRKDNTYASDGIEFKLFVNRTDFVNEEYTNQIYGHPAYPNVISVAAYESK